MNDYLFIKESLIGLIIAVIVLGISLRFFMIWAIKGLVQTKKPFQVAASFILQILIALICLAFVIISLAEERQEEKDVN